MVLEDRFATLHLKIAPLVLEDRFATLHLKIAPLVLEDRSLHSLEVLQAAGDLQGAQRRSSSKAIFKQSDLQTK